MTNRYMIQREERVKIDKDDNEIGFGPTGMWQVWDLLEDCEHEGDLTRIDAQAECDRKNDCGRIAWVNQEYDKY